MQQRRKRRSRKTGKFRILAVNCYGLVYNVNVRPNIKLLLESHILFDSERPFGNSDRELQGGGVYIRIVIRCTFAFDNGGKHVFSVGINAALVCSLPCSMVVLACFLLMTMG